ncbi:MAG: cytochrome c family protein [Rhodobacteraceae bacterium]|nr:cytochrome c family protein [Paracoccaceae bacterium]
MKSFKIISGYAIASVFPLFFLYAAFLAGNLIYSNTTDHVMLTAQTVTVPTPDPVTTEVAMTLMPALISAAAGEKVFKKCKACHTADDGGSIKTGPNLWGIVNRSVASVAEFKYSDAMLAFNDKNWEAALLDEYLTKPKALIKGTSMSFSGLKKQTDRQNLIAFLAQQSGSPLSLADLGFATAATTELAAEPAIAEENLFVAGYSNPPARTAKAQSDIDARVVKLKTEIEGMDYERARYHPLHFPPQINAASNEECLACHAEIMSHKPLEKSPSGVPATDMKAWYQTLATYDGAQADFHFRHLQSDFAKQVMNLECTFCHKGNDPREESPDMIPGRAAFSAASTPEFTLRKMVNPSTTCLLCHGAMPDPEEIMGLSGPWHESRADFEDEETLNGCLSCHGEDGFRTNRHNVTYLNAANIEDLATASSDTCYGCHGGRQWYRISYPYPRHAWPDMDEDTPDWALTRPTESDPQYQLAPPASE